ADRALDVGCGNGRHTELLAERADVAVGADVSRELLREAVARAAERGFDADFVHGDAAALPFADQAFGLATYVATV
ncbi:class I SAM-dependent methyltransferase, partial [Klebsiella pneumoniae]|nr:class I SAM-dependent methyltransferase [Klebsiella pneumoniae]